MPVSDNAIIRVNLAWINSKEDALKILDNSNHDIYLDYPDGRKKPPMGEITFSEAIEIASHPKVKYFAVSNCEDVWKIKGIISELPESVEFIPKIETEVGIKNMNAMENIGIKLFMLDKEDLYTDVKGNADKYNALVEEARKHNIIELQGVVFL